jgi:flagellin
VQSRNATNSADDRAALQKEVSQLKSEIDRVANQTTFNGTKLLDGSFTAQAFQVGANQGQTITVDAIADANIAALGTWNSVAQSNASGAAGTFTQVDLADTEEYSLEVDGVSIISVTGDADGESVTAADIDAQLADSTVQANLATAGVTVSGTAAGGDLKFTKTDGSAIDIVVANDAGANGFGGADFATGTNTVDNGAAAAAQTGFASLDISTAEGADNAILAMDAALNSVNSARADLGAVQNRFTSVIANLNTTAENLTASRSRIRDTDFAKETAELTRTQILTQAGTAMLAQANQAPQGVLSLLR